MKMAELEAKKPNASVLFLCTSPHLATMVKTLISDTIDVYDVVSLVNIVSKSPEMIELPKCEGIIDSLRHEIKKYDAIFIDEAQDFSEELACLTKMLLKDEALSRLGVFYDDVQVVRADSFGNAFMINTPPFLLHENIRNTSNIYSWTMERTNLGTDVIVNPVEGPWPVSEYINDSKHLLQRLEGLFKKFIEDEKLQCSSMVILVEDADSFINTFNGAIAKWKLIRNHLNNDGEIMVSSVEEYKGLEADMIVYIRGMNASDNLNYIAYTRARYYLLELIMK